jgi:hypothetical protein
MMYMHLDLLLPFGLLLPSANMPFEQAHVAWQVCLCTHLPTLAAGCGLLGFSCLTVTSPCSDDDVTLKSKGLAAYKYLVSNSTYMTTADFAANCAYGNDAPHGSFNVTEYKNAPVHMSKPFFLDADLSYRSKIDGLAQPDRAKHEMVFWIEPR